MSSFLSGHQGAFETWGGVPRVVLYDNLRSCVLERQGDAIRFHPTLLECAGHYRFEPRPVAVARGNEKGRVERSIRYIRTSFFAGRQWSDIEDLNQQAIDWCDGLAGMRKCPEEPDQSVNDVFKQEQSKLISLPDNPYPTDERKAVCVGKTPYVRFDLNDYSIPHTHVRRKLTVIADTQRVRISDGVKEIASHPRSFDKGQQIECAAHIEKLIQRKKKARQHRGQNRLSHAIPSGLEFLKQAADRGYVLKSVTKQMLSILDTYGAQEVEASVADALAQGVPHPNAVRISLEKRREQRHQPPPLALVLPNDERVLELVIRPHDLGSYDQLQQMPPEKGGEPSEEASSTTQTQKQSLDQSDQNNLHEEPDHDKT